MSVLEHWLDRRAVAIAGREKASAPADLPIAKLTFNSSSRSDFFADMFRNSAERLPNRPDRTPAVQLDQDHRATRSTALKAAGALLVLVGLPAARAKPARAAGSREECRHECRLEYERALAKRVQACTRFKIGDPGRTLDFLFGLGLVNVPLRVICNEWELEATRDEGKACQQSCEEQNKPTPPSRVCSVPAKGSSQALKRNGDCASFPPPPPNLDPPPKFPPSSTHDDCANCNSVGGVCCGKTQLPDGSIVICGCNNPAYPCTC